MGQCHQPRWHPLKASREPAEEGTDLGIEAGVLLFALGHGLAPRAQRVLQAGCALLQVAPLARVALPRPL